MTTVTNPGNYVDFDEYVGLKLEKTRSTIRTTDVLTALAGVAAMFLAYLLIFVVFDQWIIRGGFGVAWRWVLLSTLMCSTIAWLVWKIGVPSFRVINGLFAAREIEKAEPALKSNLLNLIDLKATGRTINPAIRKAMERQAAIQLQHVDVSNAIDHRPLVRTAYVLLAVIVIFCFYALLSPKKISNSIWRGLMPAVELPPATITVILDVKPGDMTVQAHQPFVDVQVDLAGEIPAQVLLLYSTADGKQDQPIELRPDEQGQTRFKCQLIGEGVQGLMYDVTYFIRAGDATSQKYKITVEQPPYAEIESVRIEFPAYMKLQTIEQANNGGIDAWEGAKVLINAKTNMPVRSATIQFLDDPQAGPTGEEEPMSVTNGGKHLQAQWTLALRSDGTYPKYYRIHCRTEDGRVTTGHVLNPLTIRPDLPPEVVLMHPERDLDAPANAVIAILAQARDPDFELGYIYLNIEKAGQKIVHDVLSEGRKPKLTIKHELSLTNLNAAVGDVFDVWIEAYDNKQPRPNSKNTPKVRIRVLEPVSQKQAQEQLAEQKERVDQKLADADQEMNQDQAGAQRPMDGDPKDRQPQNDAHRNDNDPNQQANPQDDKTQEAEKNVQRQQNQQRSGDNKNKNAQRQPGSGQSNETQKGGGPGSQNESSRNQSDPESRSNKPLNSDGSQDDAVLQRLNELINKNNQPKPGDSNDKQSADKPQSPQTGSDDAHQDPKQDPSDDSNTKKPTDSNPQQKNSRRKTGDTQDGADEKNKPDVKESKPKPDSPKNDSNTPDRSDSESNPDPASKNENRPDQKSPKKEMTQENGAEGSRPKTSAKNSDNEKRDKGEGPNEKQPGEKSEKSGEKSDKNGPAEKPSLNPDKNSTEKSEPSGARDSKSSDAKSPDKGSEPNKERENPNGSKPEPKSSDDPADKSSKESGAKKTDLARPEPAKDEEKNGKQPAAKPEQNGDQQSARDMKDQQNAQDPKGDAQSDKNLPKGLNRNNPKPSSDEKGDAGKPKNGSNDDKSKPKGQREQTEDTPDAKNEPGDGTEKGVAKPDRDPKAKPNATKNENVKRDPNESPETRPSESSKDPSGEKPDRTNQPPKDGSKPKTTPRPDDAADQPPSNSPEKSQDQTDGNTGGTKSDKEGNAKANDRESGQDSKDAAGRKSSKKSDGSSGAKDSDKSEPKQGEGTKEGDKSDSEPASKQDPGQSGKKQSSGAEKSDASNKQSGSQNETKPGDKSTSDKKSARSKPKSEQSGADKKGDDKPSDAESEKSGKSDNNESGKSDSNEGKGDGKGDGKGQGSKSNGKASGQKPSKQPAGPNTNGGFGGANGDGDASATHGGDVPQTEQGDDANLEYNKQASELILQKLQKDLERGDVDPQLLEELGWTKSQMKQFADRLSKSLGESKSADETAEGKARQQQFQEMLKNLDLQKSGSQRGGAKDPKRDVEQVEAKRMPPPPAYRSAYEKWTRDLARQKPASTEKPAQR